VNCPLTKISSFQNISLTLTIGNQEVNISLNESASNFIFYFGVGSTEFDIIEGIQYLPPLKLLLSKDIVFRGRIDANISITVF
jgi:hypothetical protein